MKEQLSNIESATDVLTRMHRAKLNGWKIGRQFGFWYAEREGDYEAEDALVSDSATALLERVEMHSEFTPSVVQLNPLPARFGRGR